MGEPGQFRCAEYRIGDQYIVQPRGCHHLRLTRFGDGDAIGASFDLHPGDRRGLMSLGMRPQMQIVAARVAGKPGDIRSQNVQVYDNGGCFQLIDIHDCRQCLARLW